MRVHSIVGIITNSSTEIFTYPIEDAVEVARAYLAQYIEPGTEIEDSFSIQRFKTDDSFEDALDWLPDELYDEELITDEEIDKFYYTHRKDFYKDKEHLSDEAYERVLKLCRDRYEERTDNWYDYREGNCPYWLKIEVLPSAKLVKPVDMVDLVTRLIESEECYC